VQRPRLDNRVIARSQVRAGERIVALHDPFAKTIHVVGEREWTVLGCADGTRDLDGIAAAARRLGVDIQVATIAEFLATLARLGWIAEGPPAELLAGRASAIHATPPDRPVVAMPEARMRCDGSGGCCRSYASIVFLPADVHAAELAMPAHDDAVARWLPVHGSAPTVARAVGLADGACPFLDRAGLCTIHARLGHERKPLGCRWYPARVRDDGESVRVAPAIECVCVARPRPDGDSILPDGITSAGDLPLGVAVETVQDMVAVATGRELPRATACGLADALAEAATPGDAIGWLWTLANALDEARPVDARAHAPMPAAALAEAAGRWASAAAARHTAESVWRSANDPVCVRLRTLATAAALLSSPTAAAALLATPADDAALETYVVRAGTWGRLWLGGPPLADVLREHAIVFALARAMAAVVPAEADATLAHAPLAALLAVRRTCLTERP
jgi:lysine-N-methylase